MTSAIRWAGRVWTRRNVGNDAEVKKRGSPKPKPKPSIPIKRYAITINGGITEISIEKNIIIVKEKK